MLRRDFLKGSAAGLLLLNTPGHALGAGDLGHDLFTYFDSSPYILDIQRGDERYKIDLRHEAGHRIAAYLLRDVRANRQGYPNPAMLKLAAWSQAWIAANGSHTVLKINSGLRTRATNNSIEGAARNSRHLPDKDGMFYAMDIDPLGVDKKFFGELLATPRFGGVGWYNTHIHIDIRERPAYWGKRK